MKARARPPLDARVGHPSAPHQRAKRARGYTIVELMMALVIFGVGVTGIAAMHKITAVSNRHAKNMAMATHIAQAWQEQLAADGTIWEANNLASTNWLVEITNNPNTWVQPVDVPNEFGPGFDALGNPTSNVAEMAFCAHVRLTWLRNPNLQASQNNGMIRTEVRVFWPREGRSWNNGAAYCGVGIGNGDVANIGAATDAFYFIYKTSAVRQRPTG